MYIKQISVFVENKLGRLADITEILKINSIDIRALSIADTTNFGILRLIVNDPDLAEKQLKAAGFTVSITNVIGIGIDDKPGGLALALKILNDNGIAVEYMYAFISRDEDTAFVIVRVEDNEKAAAVLTKEGLRVIDGSDIYSM